MSGRFGKAARFCAGRLTRTNALSPYDKLPSKRNSTPVPHPGFRWRQLLCRGAPTHPRKRPGGPPAAPMCSVPLAGSTRAESGKERLRKIILFGLLAMVSLAAAACAALRQTRFPRQALRQPLPPRPRQRRRAAYPHSDQSCGCCAQSDTGATARPPSCCDEFEVTWAAFELEFGDALRDTHPGLTLRDA